MCCHLSRSLTELTRHAIPHIKNNHAPPTISFVNGINQTIRNPHIGVGIGIGSGSGNGIGIGIGSFTELTRKIIPHVEGGHVLPFISFVNGINQTCHSAH